MKNIVIIGGGIIGLSTAFYLLKEGHKVTVIDQSDITSGASFVNAGFVSPSHVVPLAAPGMVVTGLKMMFNQASPFYVKPRFDIDFLKWAWAFNKSATEKHVKESAGIIKSLTVFSQELFKEMKADKIFDFHYEKKGLLMCYQTSKLEKKESHHANIAKEQGLEVEQISKKQLEAMEPELKAEGAFYYACDAHTTPGDFMQSMLNYLKNKGVIFYTNETVLDFKKNKTKVTSLTTNNRTLTFDEVVIAAGSWSPILSKKLGINLLVQAGKGYRMNIKRKTGINYPAILMERNTAVTPMDGFTRFAGTMELAGINNHINKIRVKAIAAAAHAFYPNITITEQEMNNATYGLRPVSPDGLPFIGRSKSYNNVCIATGHAMMGWSQGPSTGKLIAQIISEKKTAILLDKFSPDRVF